MVRIIVFGILLTGLLSACEKKSNLQNDTTTIYTAIASEPRTLDPRIATDANGQRIATLIYSSLVRLGPKLEIIGEAAESWEYKDKTYTFKLRPGLTFSNGRMVTEADLLYTFKEYTKPGSTFFAALKMIEHVDVKYSSDERFVKIKLKEFSAAFITDLTPVKILPKMELEAQPDLLTTSPVGSGPYTLTSFDQNSFVFKARDTPYASPKTPNLILKLVRDDNTRILKFLRGDLDILQGDIAPEKVEYFKDHGNYLIKTFPGLSMTYLLVNFKDPLLSQKQVREAILKAIDVDSIIRYKLRGLATPATSIMTPESPFYEKLVRPGSSFTEAKTLLTAVKKSVQNTLPEISLKTSNNQAATDNGKLITSDLEKAGFKIKLQHFEWATFYSDITKGNFQLATMKWVGATDPDIYRVAFHSDELPPGRNRGSFSNKILDQLLIDGLKIDDPKVRIEHYKKVQSIVWQELAMIPLWYESQVAVLHPTIKGYEPSMTGDFSGFLDVVKTSLPSQK